jgi:hypothetical protein
MDRLYSHDIMLNILAWQTDEWGKKKTLNMIEQIMFKYPAVQYFYEQRRSTL